jgi:hypothetical protein
MTFLFNSFKCIQLDFICFLLTWNRPAACRRVRAAKLSTLAASYLSALDFALAYTLSIGG